MFPKESCRKAFKVLLNALVKVIDRSLKEGEKNMTLATLVLGFALDPGNLLIWLLVGLIAGAVAGYLMRGSGYGIVGDIIVGLVGAFIGGLLAGLLFPGASFGFIGSLIFAIIGAVILIAILHAVSGSRVRRY